MANNNEIMIVEEKPLINPVENDSLSNLREWKKDLKEMLTLE